MSEDEPQDESNRESGSMASAPGVEALAVRRDAPLSVAPTGLNRRLSFDAPRRDLGSRVARLVPYGAGGVGAVAIGTIFGPVGVVAGVLAAYGIFGVGIVRAANDGRPAQRILLARANLLKRPERAEAELLEIARSDVGAPFRMEAAGHLALRDLERGEVALAVSRLSFDEGDRDEQRRNRGLERGLIGEIMRSILGWLVPDAFDQVAHSTAYELSESQQAGLARPRDLDEFGALVALLRLMEASASGSDTEVGASWRRVESSGLARFFPRIYLLARAIGARRLPHVRKQLEEDLDGEGREFLRHVFPEYGLAGAGESAYRQYAPVVPDGDGSGALAVLDAPEPVRALAISGASAEDQRRATFQALVRGVFMGAGVVPATTALGAVIAPAFAPLFLSLSCYVGAPVALIGATNGIRTARAQLRLAPLIRLPQPVDLEWLRELADAPAIRGAAEPPSEVIQLYVACALAEQAVAAGNPAEAWGYLEWWFRGFGAERVEVAPLYPVASTLVRVAALGGSLSASLRLSDALDSRSPDVRAIHRTNRGTAPRALLQARALAHARLGRWEEAAASLTRSGRWRAVWAPTRDRLLVQLVAARVAERGGTVPEGMRQIDRAALDEHEAWVRKVAPELLVAGQLAASNVAVDEDDTVDG